MNYRNMTSKNFNNIRDAIRQEVISIRIFEDETKKSIEINQKLKKITKGEADILKYELNSIYFR